MTPEEACEVIEAFQYAEPAPVCDAAVTDDGNEVGFEWTFPDGRILIVDIGSDGSVEALWWKRK